MANTSEYDHQPYYNYIIQQQRAAPYPNIQYLSRPETILTYNSNREIEQYFDRYNHNSGDLLKEEKNNVDKLKKELEATKKKFEADKKLMLDKIQSHTENDKACKICMDNVSDMVMVPCGHKFACKLCSDKITICSICRIPIVAKVKIYEV